MADVVRSAAGRFRRTAIEMEVRILERFVSCGGVNRTVNIHNGIGRTVSKRIVRSAVQRCALENGNRTIKSFAVGTKAAGNLQRSFPNFNVVINPGGSRKSSSARLNRLGRFRSVVDVISNRHCFSRSRREFNNGIVRQSAGSNRAFARQSERTCVDRRCAGIVVSARERQGSGSRLR